VCGQGPDGSHKRVHGQGPDGSASFERLTFEKLDGQSSDTYEVIATQEDGIAFRGDCSHAGARCPNSVMMKPFLKSLVKALTKDTAENGQRDVLNELQKRRMLISDCRLFVDTWPKNVGEYRHGESCDQIYNAWPSSRKKTKNV
jgi:hypothetical protein